MPDPRILPLFRWGEEMRRRRDADRSARTRILLVALVSALVAALVTTCLRPPRPRLLWNASASSPVGLYAILPADSVARGDAVIAWPPPWAARLAADRHYLPAHVPLVKTVVAIAGDRVCADGGAVLVEGRLAARRLKADSRGRALPRWEGCLELGPGELLLLSAAGDSFDGRYFGRIGAGQVVGKARLLWRG